MFQLIERHIHRLLRQLLAEEPVVVIDGPRTVGKSLLVQQIVEAGSGTTYDLDDPTTQEALEADPMTMLGGKSPVVVDEFQHRAELVLSGITVLPLDALWRVT